MSKPIILASSSPFRKSLLAKLQIPFTSVSPDIDETAKPQETANDLVKRLAYEKAYEISKSYPNALIIGSDEVAELEGQIFGKALTHENAVKQLQQVSGKTVCFYTGLCLLDSSTQASQLIVETYNVTFRKLSDATIENYLRKEQPYNSAGSIKAEGLAIALFEKMEGFDPNALIGLPLIQLVTMLKNVGVEVI